METPSPSTEQAIRDRVYRDLRPSPWVIHGKMAVSFGLGTVASLSICAQFGLAVTPWAHAVQSRLMEFGPVGCMTACGFFFAFFPLMFLRLISPPLQFRIFFRKHSTAFLAWLALSEFTLLATSGFGAGTLNILIWLVTAALTVSVGAWLFDRYIQVQVSS